MVIKDYVFTKDNINGIVFKSTNKVTVEVLNNTHLRIFNRQRTYTWEIDSFLYQLNTFWKHQNFKLIYSPYINNEIQIQLW